MSNNYRKIWETFNNAEIPKGYHIHHIDGNHDNNDPLNLQCLHPDSHHNLHLMQGDIVALNGKFIQGASAAGKLGGAAGKGSTKFDTPEKKKNHSDGLKRAYTENGGSQLKGRYISDEHKEKISIATSGENNPMYGKTHSIESRQKMSDNTDHFGENNPMHGKTHSVESRQKMSNTKRKLNKKWYTDGITSICVCAGTQPNNFNEGRTCKQHKKK